jgi:hypothetical protein
MRLVAFQISVSEKSAGIVCGISGRVKIATESEVDDRRDIFYGLIAHGKQS